MTQWSYTFASKDEARAGTEGPFYELAGNVLFPERVELIASPQSGSGPYVRLRLELDFEAGMPKCTMFAVEQTVPIEAKTISALKVGELIAGGIEWQTTSSRAVVDLTQGFESQDGRYIFQRHDRFETVRNTQNLLRQRSITDELLSEVAKVYLEDKSGKPTEAVADHFFGADRKPGAGKRTAARWVGLARDRDLIPAYERTKSSKKEN